MIVSLVILNVCIVYATDFDTPVGPIDDPEPLTSQTIYFGYNTVAPTGYGYTNSYVYCTYGSYAYVSVTLNKSIKQYDGITNFSVEQHVFNESDIGAGSVTAPAAGNYYGYMKNVDSSTATITGGYVYFLVN